MARTYTRYTKELLEMVIPQHLSFSSALRSLGKKPTGGSINNLSLMCRRWNIDMRHMTGKRHNAGRKSSKRKPANEVLVLGTELDHRKNASKLRRALLEIGREYECSVCSLNRWNDKPIVLEVDHINGHYWDNRKHNIRFICPNCHSQE